MDVSIAIVGAGFSGLGLAIRLRREGIEDFVVLERGDGVGGTWHFNTYPGCACDVPSHLYSFSFALNPGWTRTYSRQPEIRAYLERVGQEVRDKVRLRTEVQDARWDGTRWHIETSDGPVRARVLVAGTGPLVEPKFPDFPGLERFEGVTMHSARWDHEVDLRGKRVLSVGTGASAIQYVPRIAPEVAQLYVLQRTPPWVMPHSARPISPLERRLYTRFPPLQRALRGGIYAARELLVLGMVKQPRGMKLLERAGRKHMARALKDPELIARATPDYTVGCKRILPSNDWYPALARENVELVTAGVAEVRAKSVLLTDRRELDVDALVFGTGFDVLDMPAGRFVRGRDGRTLSEVWDGSPRAHLGITVPGFPNFFILLGPNTGLGHTSVVYMIEAQIAYVLDALRTGADVIEVKPEVEARFHAEVQQRMRGTVWSTGCKSWYQDAKGANPTLWPDWTWRYRRRTAHFKEEEYVIA